MGKRSEYTLIELAEDTIRKAGIPLTDKEIWDKSKEYGFQDKIKSNGKTPWKTIGARIYLDIRDNVNSIFEKTKNRPIKFKLKDMKFTQSTSLIDTVSSEETQISENRFSERELHPLLSAYVKNDSHFKCYTKTIFHVKSNNDKKGKNKWLHPDIVGVYFPFQDYNQSTKDMIKSFNENAIKLFSFEMKIKIDIGHLREYFFQAVSNSSWANEGYLVALEYKKDSELLDEMSRLNNSFGIGFIKLNPKNIEQSEILFPAKINKNLDWKTINRLVEENPDFKDFIDYINDDMTVSKVKSKYDKVMEPEEIEDYVIKHNII